MPENMTTEEVGQLLRTPTETVRYWRHIGKGPQSFKVGRQCSTPARTSRRSWPRPRRARRPVPRERA